MDTMSQLQLELNKWNNISAEKKITCNYGACIFEFIARSSLLFGLLPPFRAPTIDIILSLRTIGLDMFS